VNPIFFGDSRRPLFGVHHAPGGPALPFAAVLCNPFGQEYLRAHRSLRELASRLAYAGLHVLRFDYYGTGDSAGESGEGRPDEWVGDVALAVEEVRSASGRGRVCLLGLRLGGTLAALASARRDDVEALVLWDPVLRGSDYAGELRRRHEAWMKDHVQGTPARSGVDESLGFPLPARLVEGLASVDLDAIAAPPARRILFVSSASAEPALPRWVRPGDDGATVRRFPPSPVWQHEEGLGQSLVPRALLDAVAAWVRDSCR
jgi:alpha-beta hydrolase superfamily lysophospholipase